MLFEAQKMLELVVQLAFLPLGVPRWILTFIELHHSKKLDRLVI